VSCVLKKRSVTTSLHTADIDSSAAVFASCVASVRFPVDPDDYLSAPFNRSAPSTAGPGQYLNAVVRAIVDAATAVTEFHTPLLTLTNIDHVASKNLQNYLNKLLTSDGIVTVSPSSSFVNLIWQPNLEVSVKPAAMSNISSSSSFGSGNFPNQSSCTIT
jgi:hypothetical protein